MYEGKIQSQHKVGCGRVEECHTDIVYCIQYINSDPSVAWGVLSLNEVWVVGGEGGGVKSLLDVIKMTCLCCVVLYVTCRPILKGDVVL